MMRRAPFLARLARRYALRHKGQTLRAILGLLVATTVLATGLGLGESIAASLEEAALARFGPIEVVVAATRPFPETLVAQLAADPGVREAGLRGAPTLVATGPAIHPGTGLAEAFATIRGVSPDEARALGPLRSLDDRPIPEPRPGQVVLTATLAERLGARVGDVVTLRAARLDARDALDLDATPLLGLATSIPRDDAVVEVAPEALGLGAEAAWTGRARVTLQAESPSGLAYANASEVSPVRLVVEGPLEAGSWTIRVLADPPTPYQGGVGVAYLGADDATVVLDATVSGIAAEAGRAGITGRPAALLPLRDLQRALGEGGNATHVYYAAPRGAEGAVARLEAALGARASAFDVSAPKADLLAEAREAGAEITGFLLVMGGFTLLAAILLAYTLFSALVEERRAELGIARALGLTRGEVAWAMTIEGALYAGLAAAAGFGLGILLLTGILSLLNGAAAAQEGPRFFLHVPPRTALTALLLGVLLPLLTIGISSLRFARLDPARAIRGIPDDPRTRRRAGIAAAAVLVAAGALLALGDLSRLVGVPVLLAGLAAGLAAMRRPRVALLAALGGAAHVAWSLYAFDAFPEDGGEWDPILTLARGAVLALGLSALAVASPKPYERLARRITGAGGQRAGFLAIKYVLARRRPAGLTMAMIAVVVVVVTVMGTLFVVFSGAIPEHEAGYAVLGETALPVADFPAALPPDLARSVARADFLPRHIEFRQANVTRDGAPLAFEAGMRQFLGVTPGFADHNAYELRPRHAAYATDRDAWRAVAAGEAMLLPEWALERNSIRAGDALTVETAQGGARTYVVAGGVRSEFVWQTFLPADHVRDMGFPTGARIFVRVAPGADPDVVAHRLTAELADEGFTFTSIPEEVARMTATAQSLILVFEAFLALGLFVGLASTGFLASRAVHERMRDIGTLRALGYEEADVRRAFVLESTLTALAGIVVGTLAGLLVAHSVWWRNLAEDGAPFRPPVVLLLLFALAILGLAAVASRGPAGRAARLPPAIAVRHVE